MISGLDKEKEYWFAPYLLEPLLTMLCGAYLFTPEFGLAYTWSIFFEWQNFKTLQHISDLLANFVMIKYGRFHVISISILNDLTFKEPGLE